MKQDGVCMAMARTLASLTDFFYEQVPRTFARVLYIFTSLYRVMYDGVAGLLTTGK